ncbi:hypothetical protein AB0I54_36440 [Streptomyces sp. NPDC050625]|uniref:hypothetical protein n=1 Tax=Streptomyces sp. NPDC050625 TaxID=3154629 RepID=UPI0034351D74
MPLEDFLGEVMSLIESEPAAHEILVERVKWQRNAAAEGRYEQMPDMLSGRHRS